MKLFLKITLLLLIIFTANTACTQKTKDTITIILLRHAEKDTINPQNPPLSVAGIKRAEKLPSVFPNIKPGVFYTTNTTRTRETITPWAKLAGKELEVYDANKQQEFAELLKQQTGKIIVVAGHSNTVPQLVNFLTGTTNYSSLPDDEYSRIFIVTILDRKAEVKIESY